MKLMQVMNSSRKLPLEDLGEIRLLNSELRIVERISVGSDLSGHYWREWSECISREWSE